MQFGRRSEKLDPDQFNLALEDLEQAVAASEAEQDKAKLQVWPVILRMAVSPRLSPSVP